MNDWTTLAIVILFVIEAVQSWTNMGRDQRLDSIEDQLAEIMTTRNERQNDVLE